MPCATDVVVDLSAAFDMFARLMAVLLKGSAWWLAIFFLLGWEYL